MEFRVDAMAAPGRNDTTVFRLGVLLNDLAKLSYGRAGLHDLDGLV